MRELKVVIADDHPVVLVGLREVIQRDKCFNLVGEALNSSQLVEQLVVHQPALLITDFNMPGDETYGDGLQLIEYLIEHFPGVKILVLTMESNPLIISRLLEMGVAGVIAKNHIYQEIGKALNALAKGRPYAGAAAPATSHRKTMTNSRSRAIFTPEATSMASSGARELPRARSSAAKRL